MKKQISTKRALLTSALALLMCVAMLIGSTFAWFTDSVTSAGNIIKSGTLDVTMEWADGTKAVPADDSADWTDASVGAIFKSELWEPGYTEVRHIKIANEGTLALKYQLNIIANGDVSELADVIDVYYLDPAAQITDRTALTADKKLGTLTEVLANISTTASGDLLADEKHTVTLALKMQESAGNEYQDLAIGSDFSIQLLATQLASEFDSFDNQYDEGLDPATSYVSTLEELREALEKGGKIKLLADIVELDSSNVVPTGVNSKQPNTLLNVTKDADLDLGGHTISLNSSGTTTGSVINIKNATLNIRGEGKVIANDDSDSAGWLNGVWAGENAIVNLYGGEYSGRTGCVLYGFSNGVINVYDGTYIVNTDAEYYDSLGRWLNVNNANANTYITLYGGIYENFDFECRNMTNASDDAGNVVIADGYKGVVIDQPDGSTLGYIVPEDTTVVGGNAADLTTAIANAQTGSTVMLGSDVNYGTNQLVINKDIVLDLNGHTLTTQNAYGGITLNGGVSIKNGTINHKKTVAAIKVGGPIGSIENVDINITPIENKVITGIQLVNANKSIESLKNVVITGATQGIEVKDCSPNGTTTYAIGVMENVKVDATDVGMIINGYIGEMKNCDIKGGNIGINMLLKGEYKVEAELVSCVVTGSTAGIWAHDEVGISNTKNCALTLTYDADTVLNGGLVWDFEDECQSVLTLNKPN